MEKDQKAPIPNSGSILKPTIITLVILVVVIGVVFLAIVATRERSVSDFLRQWKEIVESKDVQAYDAICSEDFKQNFKDLYEETRSLIEDDDISVSIQDEEIERVRLDDNHYAIKHIPMSVLGKGIQTYQELYIKRKGLIDRSWKIDRYDHHFSKSVQQELEQIVENQSSDVPEEVEETPRDTEFRIRQTLEVWRTAWEGRDLNGYMDCYADYADITRVTVAGGKEHQTKLTKNELRDHMERLGKRYSRIQVTFAEPIEIEGDVAEAKAKFFQEYTSWSGSRDEPVYKDVGTKELQFVKHDVEWKITNENWTVYEGVPIYPEREY